ncbi:MAG: hypothetical protein IKS09_07530, partial [Lachnospiraceae bacterium]|nr:hypothetical protein [Lachnospiraceae bacterium]
YTVRHVEVTGEIHIERGKDRNFDLISIISGEGFVNDVPVKKGDNLIIPCSEKAGEKITPSGEMELMQTY